MHLDGIQSTVYVFISILQVSTSVVGPTPPVTFEVSFSGTQPETSFYPKHVRPPHPYTKSQTFCPSSNPLRTSLTPMISVV